MTNQSFAEQREQFIHLFSDLTSHLFLIEQIFTFFHRHGRWMISIENIHSLLQWSIGRLFNQFVNVHISIEEEEDLTVRRFVEHWTSWVTDIWRSSTGIRWEINWSALANWKHRFEAAIYSFLFRIEIIKRTILPEQFESIDWLLQSIELTMLIDFESYSMSQWSEERLDISSDIYEDLLVNSFLCSIHLLQIDWTESKSRPTNEKKSISLFPYRDTHHRRWRSWSSQRWNWDNGSRNSI